MALTLVTGGTGFVGGWMIVELLQRGDQVRTTVRHLAAEPRLRANIATGTDQGRALSVVQVDLARDAGWDAAMAGVDRVIHVASPIAVGAGTGEGVDPANTGAERVLRAARDAGVRRVVMTSGCAAVCFGGPERSEPYDESDWTDPDDARLSRYVRSKVLAERAAWDFIEREGGDLQLATVCPAGVFGPMLGDASVWSQVLVRRLLRGMPGVPDLGFGVVDVRDVVDLHLRALERPGAAGNRYIASTGSAVSILDIAHTLRDRLGEDAQRVPTRTLPNWAVKLASRYNSELAAALPRLGERRSASAQKARRELGWMPRSWQNAVVDTARSVIDHRVG